MTYVPNVQVPPGHQAVYLTPDGKKHTSTNDTDQVKTLALTVLTGTSVLVKAAKPPVQDWYGEDGKPLYAFDASKDGALTHTYLAKDGKFSILTTGGTWSDVGSVISWEYDLTDEQGNVVSHHKVEPSPKPDPVHVPPGTWITQETMAKWLDGLAKGATAFDKLAEALSDKLPEGTYLDWQSGSEPEVKPTPEIKGQVLKAKSLYIGPVDTPVTSTNPDPEDPATAPCRVFWNAHGCDKPRIHVLPGHPAGPDHQCGWNAHPSSDVEPCSKVSMDGGEAWGYDEQTGEWWPITLPTLTGEDAHGAFG